MNNTIVQNVVASFSRGASTSSINRVQSKEKEPVRRKSGGPTLSGKDRINESGNIVLKQHEPEESRQQRLQRIHMKVKGIIEQADQDGDGKIRSLDQIYFSNFFQLF